MVEIREVSRKEALEAVENIVWCLRNCPYDCDSMAYIEYDDGSVFYASDLAIEGDFRKQHIKTIIVDDEGAEYLVYGPYVVENVSGVAVPTTV